jgi:hypothetical protein
MFNRPKEDPPPSEADYQREAEAQHELSTDSGWTPEKTMEQDEFMRWQFTPDDILEFIEHELRGEDFDYQNNVWKRTGEPIMNEKGIRFLISMLRKRLNKIIFLSNLTDDHIYDIMLTLSNDLTQVIFTNGEQWELDFGRSFQDTLVNDICDLVFIGLRKAYEQGDRRSLNTITKVLHRVDETQNPDHRRKLGGIFK